MTNPTSMTREPSGHMHDCEHGFDRTLCYCDTPDACLCDTEDDNVEAAPAPTVEPSHLQEAGAASTPMTREQWNAVQKAVAASWETLPQEDYEAATEAVSRLRTEMERLEGENQRHRTTDWYSKFIDVHDAWTDAQARIAELQAAIHDARTNLRLGHTFAADDILRAALPDTEGPEHTHVSTALGAAKPSPHIGKAFASHDGIPSHTHADGVRFERPDTEGNEMDSTERRIARLLEDIGRESPSSWDRPDTEGPDDLESREGWNLSRPDTEGEQE